MTQYIEFVADRLLCALGHSKIWNSTNPFDWPLWVRYYRKGVRRTTGRTVWLTGFYRDAIWNSMSVFFLTPGLCHRLQVSLDSWVNKSEGLGQFTVGIILHPQQAVCVGSFSDRNDLGWRWSPCRARPTSLRSVLVNTRRLESWQVVPWLRKRNSRFQQASSRSQGCAVNSCFRKEERIVTFLGWRFQNARVKTSSNVAFVLFFRHRGLCWKHSGYGAEESSQFALDKDF